MFKVIFRLFGILFLVLTVITIVLDMTRSIADSAIVWTALGKEWFDFSASSLNLMQAVIQRYVHPTIWDPVIVNILLMPSWAVFAALAAIFLWFGRTRKSRWQTRFGG